MGEGKKKDQPGPGAPELFISPDLLQKLGTSSVNTDKWVTTGHPMSCMSPA